MKGIQKKEKKEESKQLVIVEKYRIVSLEFETTLGENGVCNWATWYGEVVSSGLRIVK